jgi:hypothetical protein
MAVMNGLGTSYNSGYAVSLLSVATPKLPYATLRATSHTRGMLAARQENQHQGNY